MAIVFHSKFRRAGLVVAALALFGFVGVAEAKPKKGKPQQIIPTGAEDAPSGARTAAAPSASQAAAEKRVEAMTDRSDQGLVKMKLADGTEMIDLQGRFAQVVVVQRDENGKPVAACHAGDDAVQAAKRAPAPAPTKRRAAAKPVLEEK